MAIRRLPKELGKYNIRLSDQEVTYTLKRSYRARCVRLEIHQETGLTVFVPRTYKINDLPSLLNDRSRWIIKKLAQVMPTDMNSDDGEYNSIQYLGGELALIKKNRPYTALTMDMDGKRIVVCFDCSKTTISEVLNWWLRRKAQDLLDKKVEACAKELGVKYNKVKINRARTRWGSCSPRGNLNFNIRLIMAPEPVIDYVVVHELCHLKEMNHSRRFWNIVERYCPDWRTRREWLETHEAELKTVNI
jgi:predicted metal-dependent hydrolase